jgi:hypothetical protein
MPFKKMRALLNKAAGQADPDEPDDGDQSPGPINIGVAVANAAEVQGVKLKKRAVMFLHRTKAGPQLLAELADIPGFQKPTFAHGSARIDPADEKVVLVSLNKENKGVANLLKKTLKGTGRKFVKIFDPDGKLMEEDVQEEPEDLEDTDAGTAPASAAPAGASAEQAPSPTPWNPAELTARLTGLVKQMLGMVASVPDRAGELKDLATQAQAAIKAGAETAATEAVDAFASALAVVNQGLASVSGANAGPAPNPTVLAKSGLAWVAALKRVQDDFGKLQQAMVQHYDGKPFVTELEKLLQAKVAPIMTTLDQTLASKLEDAGKSADGAEQQKLLGEARQMIGQYESFVTGNDLLTQLDANPFVPLQTQKTLVATLGALKKSVG